MKLWEFARLFAVMACLTLVFPSQKLNSNGTLQRDTREFNAAFSQFLQFLLCNLRYKCPNWTELERLTRSVYLSTTVDGFFIFRVISFLSLFLLKKLGYLFPFDLFGQFWKFSKVTRSNLIISLYRFYRTQNLSSSIPTKRL